MFFQHKKYLILIYLIFLFLLIYFTSEILAANSLTPEEVIKADILAQNNHDLSTYLSLRTTKVGPPENRNEIMILREKYPEYDILQNTVKAQVVGIKSIPLTLIESITKIDEYFNLFSEIEAYYVAIDYQLESENQYVFNGVNYRLYLLALEEDQWVIIQISHIPVHRMIEEGYGFGTEGYERLIKAHQIPSTIRVYRSSSGSIDVVDFDYYVKNVLPNEWIGSWPIESLYAGALACKMYGWYHVLYPRSTYYDVRDDIYDQVYAPGSEYYRTNQAVDDMDGIGVERDDGALFETQYLAGTYGPDKPSGEYEGRMSQWGTKYWADQGKDYAFMVHYYWDNSPQAGYQIVNIFGSTVELAPPPEHVYPLNNSTIYTTTPTFEWNSVSTADGYGLYIRDIASGVMVYETEEQPLYGTSLELLGGRLENGRSYWWNMNSYNSAGWNPECSTHWKFTVQVDNYPTVNSFSVNPTSVTSGNSFNISYTVSDDIGLQQTELWRANDVGGEPVWPSTATYTTPLSGQTNYSGSFTDTPNSTGIYYYGMHVVDTSGNWSVEPDPPGPIMVTVTNPIINPPTGVQASDGTYTDKVRITWNSVTGASYYHVYRATSSEGSKISLGSWQSSNSYDDTSASPGQTYYYFVKAATSSSGSNASDYSVYNEGWRKLSPPTGVNASDGTYTDKVGITWNSVSGASYYRVYRATSSGGTKTSLSGWQSSTSYDDTSATPGQTYYYFIKAATSSSGYRESDYSSYNTGFCSLPLTRIIRLVGDLNFGNVQVESTSQKTLTIFNDGNSTLTVYGIDCPAGFSGVWSGAISAGSSHNVTVTFSPTQLITYGGNLIVNSDATSGNNFKSLSGTGVPSTYPPQVTTNNASNITSTSAQLNGNLDSIGNLICQVWFECGKTTSYGISTTKQSKSSVGPFNDTIISLDPNTTYHFKAYASNSEETVYGADKIFITPMLGDFGSANNGPPDCKVDFEDLMIFALAYGATPSDANWNPVCDIASLSGSLVPDGIIDFEDLMVFAMHYGDTCEDL